MSEARQAIINSFGNPDPASWGVFRMIEQTYPAFAKKIFQNNAFMQKLVMTGLNPMHIMDYPICGRCETLAVPDRPILKDGRYHPACGCFADGCGAKTIDPITFREWLVMEMRRKAPPEYVENIEYVVDRIAEAMLARYVKQMRQLREVERFINQKKMGLIDSSGNLIKQEEYKSPTHHKVTLTIADKPVDLQEEALKIGSEEQTDVRSID